MTIKELYEWSVGVGVEDYTIVVRQGDGSTSWYVEPTIDNDKQEVEL